MEPSHDGGQKPVSAPPKQEKSARRPSDDSAPNILKQKKFAGSSLSVKTLDLYDPYDYRDDGHLSNFQAWAHLVKCSFGTGVLTMPKGFQHSGLILGFLLGGLIGAICLYCMLVLIKSCVHMAARQRVPYMPFNESMKYTFEHGYPLCKPLSRMIVGFTDSLLVGYHFGICACYVNYMAQTTLRVFGKEGCIEGYNWPTVIAVLAWMPLICAINCVRNLKLLAPVSYVGNVLTLASMGIILYYIFKTDPDRGFLSDSWQYVGQVKTIPLYIGIILFAVEAFGVIIAVERDMRTPRKFVGVFGVFNQAMFLVLGWYIFLGATGYLRYGAQVQSTISLTIPPDHWSSTVMYVMLALSLLCSYPLHCYVCIDIIWKNRVLPKLKQKQLLLEFVFRISLVVVSCIVAVIFPQLDLLVSLIGAVCLSFLGIMMPGVMEYNVAWSKSGMQWNPTMVKDIIIAVFGFCAFFIGTYGCLFSFFDNNPENHEHGNSTKPAC
uniref:Proton-coupled amino acid transporter 4 n=1 Tax=Lygus hesperus TaxID=30085 RepID=A0A0A9YD85_LYGHE